MSDDDRRGSTNHTWRLLLLIVAGLAITNIVAAMLFDRNTALGVDELLVAVVGVGLALLVEFGVFRRGRP
jgi:hypothetical protein